MTRNDVLKLFPDATDDQITNLLNQNNQEVAREKNNAEKYKADAQKAANLQQKLDELNNQNLSDIEKANAERDKALNSVTDLQNQIKSMQLKAGLAEQGIIGEQADKLIESLNSGSFDTALLGQIITEKNQVAISEYEKKNLNGTPNPSGGNVGNENKSTAEKIAEKMFSSQKQNNNILSHYVGGN